MAETKEKCKKGVHVIVATPGINVIIHIKDV